MYLVGYQINLAKANVGDLAVPRMRDLFDFVNWEVCLLPGEDAAGMPVDVGIT